MHNPVFIIPVEGQWVIILMNVRPSFKGNFRNTLEIFFTAYGDGDIVGFGVFHFGG
jgi:hypothetical protein